MLRTAFRLVAWINDCIMTITFVKIKYAIRWNFVYIGIFACLTLFPPTIIRSQNLIPNPGFEFNKDLSKNKGQSVSSEFANVSGWNIIGWQSFYCHCNRNPEQNWTLPACRKNLYSPKTGCGMIKMVYEENCNSDPELNSEVRLQGCTSYLESKLSSPLEVGAVYEMSFWIYFPIDSIVESSIAYNIGFLPSLHSINMSPNNMLNINTFFHDTIPQGQWSR